MSMNVKSCINEKPRSYQVLQSRGGKQLPVELCLNIFGQVLRLNPKAISNLKSLCRYIEDLLSTHETSVVKLVYSGTEVIEHEMFPSCKWPEKSECVQPLTYRWLVELRTRSKSSAFLLSRFIPSNVELEEYQRLFIFAKTSADLEATGDDISLLSLKAWTPYQPPSISPIQLFKRTGVDMLYEIADMKGPKSYIEELNPLELATLGIVVRSISLGYGSTLTHLRPSSVREHVAVFENKLLQYGPYFAFAARSGSGKEADWARTVIEQGLVELEDYETGVVVSQKKTGPSLQSTLWRSFCSKAQCEIGESIDVACQMVEDSYQ